MFDELQPTRAFSHNARADNTDSGAGRVSYRLRPGPVAPAEAASTLRAIKHNFLLFPGKTEMRKLISSEVLAEHIQDLC